MVLTAEPGTPSHERLRIRASWTAEPHPGPGADRRSVEQPMPDQIALTRLR
jgi:hypothetical protein